jgi:hypothetical protein
MKEKTNTKAGFDKTDWDVIVGYAFILVIFGSFFFLFLLGMYSIMD